eukprot:TRINITY_DN1498_c0_g1_i2.p2 TRINITY_DN1498_c0_g1~~TRINITY_DN1498_c0_g1_i2.p2  ORF type:complete len:100 (+),score=37.73 TRINITY_DN1498_c0_g1_i2:33-332(+)
MFYRLHYRLIFVVRFFFFFFFKQKTAYEMLRSLVGSEMCIRDRYQRRVRGRFNHFDVRVYDRPALMSGCRETQGDLNAAFPFMANKGIKTDQKLSLIHI